MEYSYYRDARHHYLTIPCESVETYQYRMLAANRMDTLISCSIRSLDGQRFLYYDITARENMDEFFRGHGSAATEIPRLLYAIADAGAVLERYLLDCRRILLSPEFVYYDYTRGEFSFIYYPEDLEEPTGPAFYEYLVDHADPQDKMLYYTLLRLITISANQTFLLDEAFLEKSLGRKRPQEQPAMEEDLSSQARYAAEVREQDWVSRDPVYREAFDDPGSMMRRPDRECDPVEEYAQEAPDERGMIRGWRLVLLLVLAVLFLAGAIALALVRVYIPMDETYSRAALVGMIACLAASILTAAYGAYRGVRRRGQELTGMRERATMERQNALAPVEEFR